MQPKPCNTKLKDRAQVVNNLDALFVEFLYSPKGLGRSITVFNSAVKESKKGKRELLVLILKKFHKYLYENYRGNNFIAVLLSSADKWNTKKAEWLKHSRNFGLKIKTEELEEDYYNEETDDETTKALVEQDYFERIHNGISLWDRLDENVKSLFRLIPSKTRKDGLPQLAKFRKVFYTAHEVGGGKLTIQEILKAWDNSIPELQELVRRLPIDANYNPLNNSEAKKLLLAIYEGFGVSNVDVNNVVIFSDNIEYIRETNTNVENIKKEYQRRFNIQDDKKIVNGKIVQDVYTKLKNASELSDPVRRGISFFKPLGITFSDKTLLDPEFGMTIDGLFSIKTDKKTPDILRLVKAIHAKQGGMHRPINELSVYTSKEFGISGFRSWINKLIQLESKYSDVDKTKTVLNANGDRIQAESSNNTVLQVQNLRDAILPDYTEQTWNTLEEDQKIVLSNYNSIMFKHSQTYLQNKRGKIEDYNGIRKNETGEAWTSNSAPDSTWLMSNISTLLEHGTKELLRTETSSSSWAYNVGEPWVRTKRETLNAFKNYFIGDLARLEAYVNSGIQIKSKKYNPDIIYIPFKQMGLTEADMTIDAWPKIEPLLEEWLAEQVQFIKDTLSKEEQQLLAKKFQKKFSEPISEIATYNLLIHNIEEFIVLHGGLEHYADPYKRIKALISTGNTIPQDDWVFNVTGRLTNKKASKTIRTAIIASPETIETKDSTLFQGLDDKFITRAQVNGYGNMEIADGQGYINLDFYRFVGKSINNWTDLDEQLYNWEADYYFNIIKGNKPNWNAPRPNHQFSVRKMQYFGGTSAYSELNLQIFDKFSLSPLIPSVVHNKEIQALMETMHESNMAYVKMDSGTKLSMTQLGTMSPSKRLEELNANSYEIHTALLKEQLPTKPKVKDKNIYGSQFRKLVLQDMLSNGKWKHKDFQKLYEEYTNILDTLTNKAKEELYEELGISEVNGRIIIDDFKPLITKLEKEAVDRDMIKTVIDFIRLNGGLKDSIPELELPFETSSNKQTLENILQGLINKKLLRQEVNGSQLIQLSAWGYRKGSKSDMDKWGSDLAFYKPGKPAETKLAMSANFKPLIKKYGSLAKLNEALSSGEEVVTLVAYRIPTQGLSSMDVFNVKEFLPQSAGNIIIPPPQIVAKNGSDFDIDKMNFIFPRYDKTGKKLKNIKPISRKEFVERQDQILAELIPTKEALKILSEEMLEQVQLETNKQTLTEYFNWIRKTHAAYALKKKLTTPTVKEIDKKIFTLQKERSQYYERDARKRTLEQKQQWDRYTKLIKQQQRKIPTDLVKARDLHKQLIRDYPTKEFRAVIDDIRLQQKDIKDKRVQLFEELEELKLRFYEYKNSITNDLLDNTQKILLHPANYETFINPLSTDLVDSYIKQNIIKPLYGDQTINGIKTIELKTMYDKRIALNRAKRLLGVAAVSVTFLQLWLRSNIQLNKTYFIGNKEYTVYQLLRDKENLDLSNQLMDNGILKSEIYNQLVNATVDAAKDDFLGLANIVMENIGVVMYNILQGIPFERTIDLFNQPVIFERLKRRDAGEDPRYINSNIMVDLFDELPKNHPLQQFIKGTDYITIDYNGIEKWAQQNMDIKNRLVTYTPQEGRMTVTTDQLKNPLIGDPEYIETQIVALAHYVELRRQSGQMYVAQQILNVDTARNPTAFHAAYQKTLKQSLVKQDSIQSVKENTPIRSFFINDILIETFETVLPFQNDKYFVEQVTELRKEMQLPANQVDKFIRVIKNHFVEYIIKHNDDLRLLDEGKITDKEKLITNVITKVFNKYQKELTDNEFFKNAYAGQIAEINTILLKDNSADADLRNLYTEGLEELSMIDIEDAQRIAIAGFYQSGFNRSYYSWFDIVPPELLTKHFKTHLSIDKQLVDRFIEYWKSNFTKTTRGRLSLNLPTDGRPVMLEPLVQKKSLNTDYTPIPVTREWNRETVEADTEYLYLFTDNAKRTSGKNWLPKNSAYTKKYFKNKTRGKYPTTTQAVLRGLNNAFPITTMVDEKKTQWSDKQFERYKDIIDDEIATIKRVYKLGNFKGIKYSGQFGAGSISKMKDLAPAIWGYLNSKLTEIGIDNTDLDTKPLTIEEDGINITTFTRNNREIGSVKWTQDAEFIYVHEATALAKQSGIGTMMYDYLEDTHGLTVKYTKQVSDDGRAFREKRLQNKMVELLPKYINPRARKHQAKELFKIKQATSYIGQGATDSSTDRYRRMYETMDAANTGEYDSKDLIYVSSNGKRNNRIAPVVNNELQGAYKNMYKAMEVGARFIMDTKAHLDKTKNYNLGEIELQNFLNANGYTREDETGIWSKIEIEVPKMTIEDIILESKNFKLTPDQKHYVDTRTGKLYQRVTDYLGLAIDPADVNKPIVESGKQIGNKLDEFTRDFFSNNLKQNYNVFDSPETRKTYETGLQTIKDQLDRRGEVMYAEGIFLYSPEHGVGGTPDLVTRDSKGVYRIYDLKTIRNGVYTRPDGISSLDIPYGNITKRLRFTNQVNLYAELLERMTGTKINTIGILPVRVSYAAGDVITSDATIQKGIPLERYPHSLLNKKVTLGLDDLNLTEEQKQNLCKE